MGKITTMHPTSDNVDSRTVGCSFEGIPCRLTAMCRAGWRCVMEAMLPRSMGATIAETQIDPPLLGHFEILQVEDGDIVVFSTPEVLTAEQVARLQLQMRKQLDHRRLFAAAPIVIDRGLRIVILRPGEPST